MKKLLKSLSVALFALAICSCNCGEKSYVIRTETPQRPAGQEDMIGYAADPIDTVRVGFVGLGARGLDAVRRFNSVPWSKIAAVCEVNQERMDAVFAYMEKTIPDCPRPKAFVGPEAYKELCASEDVDIVYICTDWLHHTPVALCAMENGKHAAVEVPCALTLDDCWALVNASEKTRRHCVILENCCYDFFEMSALEMARQGVLGDIVHAEGAYHHNLEPYWNQYKDDWRLSYNAEHKGDLYPTHGLGPVSQVLNINRGDRYTTLVAMESASISGPETMKKLRGIDVDFQNADLTCTLLKTANGRSVLIEHDVLTPRPYNRMYQLVGTKGYAAKYPVQQIFLTQEMSDSLNLGYDTKGGHAPYPQEYVNKLREMFPHPVLDADLEQAALKVGGHGGMDYIMDYRLIYCLHYGLPVDMDVYDLASWCCLADLGSTSIKAGFAPVEVPDFTRGGWEKRQGMKYAFKGGELK